MANTATAFLKWPVALSCFAAQRTLGVLPISDWKMLRGVQRSLYEAGESAKKDFRTNTLLFGSFQFGDKAQSAFATVVSDAMALKVVKPSYMASAVWSLVQGSSDAMAAVRSQDARGLLADQFRNTGDVLGFVNSVDAPMELAGDGSYPVAEKSAEFYSRGHYPALWLIEGLGERFAHAHLSENRDLRDLLTSGSAAALPVKTRLMMHAGMGIAFAKYAVDGLTPWSSAETVCDALRRFLRLVRRNSMPGYEGAALESLGLVTQTWYGQLVKLVNHHLLALDADATEFFWHGAGRAMYFSPMYMLPGLSPWEAAEEQPPDETARRNARAGVAWAFTIVNVRHPGIAANFLRRKSDRIAANDAYTNGVHSTLVMAGEMVPGHSHVVEFCRFRPEADDPQAATAWTRHIGRDVEERVNRYRQSLTTHHLLGEIFRYHDLADFIAHLER